MKATVLLSLACWLSVGFPVRGIEAQSQSALSSTQALNGAAPPSLVTRLNAVNARSPNILAEVEKMVKGGADAEVIKAYVKNWTGQYWLGADEILRLHEGGVPGDILVALIERSAELRAHALSNAAAGAKRSLVTTDVAETAGPAVSYPQMAQAPTAAYSNPVSFPAYTYSDLYPYWSLPTYSYRYWWTAPYTYSFAYYPFYRHKVWPHQRHWYGHGFHNQPFVRHQPWRGHGFHRQPFVGHRSWSGHGFQKRPFVGHRPALGHGFHRQPFGGHGSSHGHGFSRFTYTGQRPGGAWRPATQGFRVSHGARPGRR